MHNSFVAGSKLRQWLSRQDCPPAIRACKLLFDRTYRTSLGAPSEQIAKEDEESPRFVKVRHIPQVVLPPQRGEFIDRYQWNNIHCTTRERHLGNSQIMFFPEGGGDLVPAIIEYINVSEKQTFFVVRRFLPRDGTPDAFSRYSHFPARVYSTKLAELELIERHHIRCHFASLEIRPSHHVVLSLFRVRSVQSSFNQSFFFLSNKFFDRINRLIS